MCHDHSRQDEINDLSQESQRESQSDPQRTSEEACEKSSSTSFKC